MSYHATAFTFACDATLEVLRGHFVAITGWPWQRRENDRYGDYHSASPGPAGAIARLIEEPGCFVFDLEFKQADADQRSDFAALRAHVRDVLLPAVGAREVHEVAGYGR